MNDTSRSVTELFKQYLQRQIAAQAEGLAFADPDGLVVPHDAGSMQPVDPRLAWEDALAITRWSMSGEKPASSPRWEAPPDWPGLVAALEPAISLAFCIGNFPQMVRNLQPLLAAGEPAQLHQTAARPANVPPALLEWASVVRSYPQLLVAAGVLRLARRFEEAIKLLNSKKTVPADWRMLRDNEEAALAWHRGHAEEALLLWQNQKSSVPVLFNRGMATLFLGRPVEARTSLEQAIAQLPETSAWHHLGHLYLTFTAVRS